MRDASVTARRRPRGVPAIDRSQLPDDLRALGAGTVAVFLMIFWSVDDGGTDASTWYWGALLALAGVAALLVLTRGALGSLPRAMKIALVCFALYTAWSYLSMTWAPYAGLALEGSNRTLLYLLIFTMMAIAPWRRTTALLALGAFATGIGVIAVAFLVRFALGDGVAVLFVGGRMAAPTGYFNSTAALFTAGALVALALAAHRPMSGVLRGAFAALAAADFMLAIVPQSRGWLFTLPIVALWAVLFARERLRAITVALPACAGALVDIRPLLRLFQLAHPAALTHLSVNAGKIGLLSCAGVFALVTLASWIEAARARPPLRPLWRRLLGAGAVATAGAAILAGLYIVSDHHPASFVSRQWHGFTRVEQNYDVTDHFVQVGSGRYDIWRSAFEAWRAHPIGGLGQDNFGDWYLTHRHTTQEPLWTHSLWLRLLAHTGTVGFLLFVAFLIAALIAASRARRRDEPGVGILAGAALMPLGVWLIHGSIDWFWEVPALTGPALGFLAMSGRLRLAPGALESEASPSASRASTPAARRAAGLPRVPAPVAALLGGLALVAATVVLGLPFLAERELVVGIDASHQNVNASLADFRASHRLDPLMSPPGTLGGSVALVNGHDATAATLFRQAVSLEPGDWIAWLGRGLAASMQGQVGQARSAYRVALRLDSDQLAVRNAWKRVGSQHPLTPTQAFAEINYLP